MYIKFSPARDMMMQFTLDCIVYTVFTAYVQPIFTYFMRLEIKLQCMHSNVCTYIHMYLKEQII